MLLDHTGTVLAVNRRSSRPSAGKPEQLLGRDFLALIHPDVREQARWSWCWRVRPLSASTVTA